MTLQKLTVADSKEVLLPSLLHHLAANHIAVAKSWDPAGAESKAASLARLIGVRIEDLIWGGKFSLIMHIKKNVLYSEVMNIPLHF